MGKSLEDCGSAPIGVRGSAESWGHDSDMFQWDWLVIHIFSLSCEAS